MSFNQPLFNDNEAFDAESQVRGSLYKNYLKCVGLLQGSSMKKFNNMVAIWLLAPTRMYWLLSLIIVIIDEPCSYFVGLSVSVLLLLFYWFNRLFVAPLF